MTLKEILADQLIANKLTELKTKKENFEKETDEEKKTEKKAGYDKERTDIIDLINKKADELIETEKRASYSEEMKKRMAERKVSDLEKEISKAQSEVDILTLDIADIDKEIEDARLSLSGSDTAKK